MYRTSSLDRTGSVSSGVGVGMPPPLSPSDSCVSISSFRPSLVWLFNHIRHEGRENLIKEDLRKLLGATVDNAQLNEAFDHLDLDGDGEISLDEFIGGFAKFWKEAPHTPGYEKLRFSFPSQPEVESRRLEEHYEGEGGGENHFHEEVEEPTEEFKRSLVQLSSHNRCVYEGGRERERGEREREGEGEGERERERGRERGREREKEREREREREGGGGGGGGERERERRGELCVVDT